MRVRVIVAVLAPRVDAEALHLRALLRQPLDKGEEAGLGDVELPLRCNAIFTGSRAQLEVGEELLVRGEQSPRLTNFNRAVHPLLEPGVLEDLDQ